MRLASGKLKQVQDLDSDDFLYADSSVVREILEVGGGSSSHSHTVLIKFFVESRRSTIFTEAPVEHPFFVLHRGWSSWDPQQTYDKFGLKCRKLKIGDTCVTLVRNK